jgi:hypothetical protein
MLRAYIVVVAMAVGIAGCAGCGSKASGPARQRTSSGSTSPSVPVTAAPGASPTIRGGSASSGAGPSGGGGGGAAPQQVVPPGSGSGAVSQATVHQPRAGAYVYYLGGSRQIPGAPGGKYSGNARLTIQVAQGTSPCSGSQIYARTTTNEDPGVDTTSCGDWRPSGVFLDFTELVITALGDWKCAYAPPPEILQNPIKSETFPTQSWSGNSCSGSVQITVVDQEQTSAAGRTWTVWKVTSHTTSTMTDSGGGSLSGTVDSTSWLSPDLGEAIKADATSSGSLNGQPVSSHQVTVLQSAP